jgi:hypothetical protein
VVEALVVARLIWLQRNTFVFENDFSRLVRVIESSKQAIADYIETFHRRNRPPWAPMLLPNRWTQRPYDKWKTNVDAAVGQVDMKMGVGIVNRNAAGRVVAARAHQIPFIVDPLLAKAIAAWHAISFGREVGVAKVILEGDSLVVMSALMKEEVCNRAYGQIIHEISNLAFIPLSLSMCC